MNRGHREEKKEQNFQPRIKDTDLHGLTQRMTE